MERNLESRPGVYCIRNRYDKSAYVGSAHNLRTRCNLHLTNLRAGNHHSQHLQRAWQKYGPGAFEFLVLERCGKDDVLGAEQFWLDTMSARYNVSRIAGSRAGVRNRPEHNAAIAAKARERWADPAFKARMRKKLREARKTAAPRSTSERDRLLTAFGKTQCLNAWAVETGIKRETIAYRINHGCTVEDALTLKRMPRRDRGKKRVR